MIKLAVLCCTIRFFWTNGDVLFTWFDSVLSAKLFESTFSDAVFVKLETDVRCKCFAYSTQHSLLFATTKQWLQYPKRSYSTILSQVILFPPTETTCGLPDGFDNDFTRYYWPGKKPFNRELEAISSLLLKTIAITTSLFSFTRACCKRNIKESRSGNWMLSLSTVDACMDPVYARMLKSLTGCLIELSASHFY